MVARWNAARAAPARRRPAGRGRPGKILINGMEPYEYLRASGATYSWQIPEGF
jgi:hypothetical protein